MSLGIEGLEGRVSVSSYETHSKIITSDLDDHTHHYAKIRRRLTPVNREINDVVFDLPSSKELKIKLGDEKRSECNCFIFDFHKNDQTFYN